MERLQSIGALLTALMAAMIVTVVAICATAASNAFLRKQEAAETLAVVELKRSTLLPEARLRDELGLERARLFFADKVGADDLRDVQALHAAAETALQQWIAEIRGLRSRAAPLVLDDIQKNKTEYAKLWPVVLAAIQRPAAERPAGLADRWTAAVDGLQGEIDGKSQDISDRLIGSDTFIREMLRLHDLGWAVRVDAGIDRRFLARTLIEHGRHPLDVHNLDQLAGRIDARWEIIVRETGLPFVPDEMKAAVSRAQHAYFGQYRPVRNMLIARLARGEVLPESRMDLLKISNPSFGKLAALPTVALSLTEARARANESAASRTFAVAIAAMLLFMALGCVLAAYVMGRVVWPLKRITQIMKKVAEGDYCQRVPFKERKDEIGHFSRALQMFRDSVAEKQRLEIDLVRNQAEKQTAENSSRLKSEFLANMSHELRTPLNAILGFSEVIQAEVFGPATPKYRDYARDIHGAGEHLLSLINDILDISKAEAGKLELRREAVDLGRLVKECVRLVRGNALEHGLQINAAIEAMPPLEIDRLRIKQVLLNLLSNAIKFTGEGGVITVEAGPGPSGAISLQVRDTGIGIPAELIPMVFEPFRQVDSTLARKFEGTGLGLTLVRRLVELHGGTVELQSVVNEGTSVSVSLPGPHWRQAPMPLLEPAVAQAAQ